MAHFFKYLAGTEAGSDVHISKTTQRVPLKEPLQVGLYGGSNLIVEMNRLAGGTPDSAAGQPIYAKVEPADAATVAPPLSQVFVVSGLVLGEMNLRCANPTDFVTWDTIRIKVVDGSKKTVPTLTDDLKAEYKSLFAACRIRSANQSEVDEKAKKIVAGKDRYSAVGTPLNIPWWFIGILHVLESSANFAKHLHNGDPLTARTVQVPAGRPTTGSPPFTWEDSAKDALTYHNFNTWSDWTLPGVLYAFEKFNGFGVRMYHAEKMSAYLWSYTTLYGSGKYKSDGKWDETLVSQQPGTAALLKALIRDKAVTGLD